MEKKILNVVSILLIIAGIGILVYMFFFKTPVEEEPTVFDKLETASFVLDDGYYVRSVVQGEDTYKEVFALSEDKFMRILGDDSEQELFVYNYMDNTFDYYYYFEGELIISMEYNYASEMVVSDEDSVYDSLAGQVTSLKEYFNELLSSNNMEVSEL